MPGTSRRWPGLVAALTLAVSISGPGVAFAQGGSSGAPGHPSAERSEAAFMRAGDMALSQGETLSAIEFFQRAASLAPRDPAPLVRLGDAYAASGGLAAAYEAYQQALARGSQSPSLDLDLGRLALRLDHPREAVAHFEAARKRREDVAVWNGLGVAHDAMGDHVQAQSDYRKGLALKPGDISLRNNLGLSQALAGNYAEAIATLSSVAADPGAGPGNRLNLAMVYGLAGDDDKASQAARRDLGESDNTANRRYYALLRAMDDRSRTRAILGLGGSGSGRPGAPPAP